MPKGSASTTVVVTDNDLTPADLAKTCTLLYQERSRLSLLKQHWRPYICPFHRLLPLVPANADILDVGCGSGVFLGLLAHYGQICRGTGFDSDRYAIGLAQQMTIHLPLADILRFEQRHASEDWPNGSFDVVSILDVMHHIPKSEQRQIVESAAARLQPGGLLIYKDMVEKPHWRAWANRCHDLILSQDWINYVPIDVVEKWSREAGLLPIGRGSENMFWYGHDWLVCRQP
ncbi:MAG: class I SAM-dependent methyltransferase [Pseudomonadota bacterium]